MPIGNSYRPGLFTWPETHTSLVPGLFSGPIALYQCGAAIDDVRHVRERLDVVDDSRASEGADDRGEWRPVARVATLAFERFQQRAFLAADVRARALMRPDVHAVAGAHYVLADVARGACVSERRIDAALLHGEFAAQVNVRGMRADRAAGDQDALDDAVRIVFELIAIGEGARLALIAIDADVNRFFRILGNKTPLHSRRKRRAAASAEIRVLDFVDDVVGRHLEECLARGLVAVVRQVHVELAKIRDIQPAGQYPFHVSPVRPFE